MSFTNCSSNEEMFKLLNIDNRFLNFTLQSQTKATRQIKHAFKTKKLPLNPIPDLVINTFLDSLTFEKSEFHNSLHKERMLNQTPSSKQPLAHLTTNLLKHALNICGYKEYVDVILVPWATGFTISFCLSFLQSIKKVLWIRIDQKSCIKSVELAHEMLSVEPHELNYQHLANVDCVISTTSCFAPREPDDVVKIAKLCSKFSIVHLINNAYGVQSNEIASEIERAARVGRVDYVIQSMDKNFMVPVGGSIVLSYKASIPKWVHEMYGDGFFRERTDLLITLLSMGQSGLKELLNQRKICFIKLKNKLTDLQNDFDVKLIRSEKNPISLALELRSYSNPSVIGSRLFYNQVSGCRVLTSGEKQYKLKSGQILSNFGMHKNNVDYNCYLNAAAAMGITENDIEVFIRKIRKVLVK